MNILLIGSGGRESAISKFLSKNKNCNLYSIMSYHNPDIVNNSKEYLIESEENINEIIKYSNKNKIELAFLGSEVSINAGIADALKKNNINVIGPVQSCAKIETDKGWARNFISKYIPLCNPKYKIFDFKNPNSIKEAYKYIEKLDSFVIKPTGLTGGKGVQIFNEQIHTIEDAKKYIFNLLKKTSIIIEEKMNGNEYTLQAFTDGVNLLFCPLVRDHKRLTSDTMSLNTGGMGSYSCSNHLLPYINNNILDQSKFIMKKTIKYLFKETGFKYKGILYGQFILTDKNEIKIVEYNCRFGDPESLNVLELLNEDLVEICNSIINENLNKISISFKKKATVCKYLVPNGYPLNSKIEEIKIEKNYFSENVNLYYGSVNNLNNKLYTTKSRSLAILGIGNSIQEAEEEVEKYISLNIKTSLYHRNDIGKILMNN